MPCSEFYIYVVFEVMRKIILYVSFFILLNSCKKSFENNAACGPPPVSCGYCDFGETDYFSFTLIDKISGADLIFSSNPSIAISEVKLFYNTVPMSHQIPFQVDSTNKLLKSYKSSTFISRDTLWLKIKNDIHKKIVVRTFCSQKCCSSNITEILYDGNTYIAGIDDLIKIKY